MHRIQPAAVLTARGHDAIAFGVFRPQVLRGLDPGALRFVERLRTGVPEDRVAAIARACGCAEDRAVEVVAILARAGLLVPEDRGPAPHRDITTIASWAMASGSSPERLAAAVGATPILLLGAPVRLAETLRACSFAVTSIRDLGEAHDQRPRAVTVLWHELAVDAAHIDHMVSRDLPHLPVLVDDEGAHIGPVTRPGIESCAGCGLRRRLDGDPSWIDCYRLLLGRRLDHPDPALLIRVEAAIIGQLRRHVMDPHGGVRSGLRLTIGEEAVVEEIGSAHPECSCLRPAALDAAALT